MTVITEVTEFDDIIDSRSVIDRIEELTEELTDGAYETFRQAQMGKGVPEDDLDTFDTWLDGVANEPEVDYAGMGFPDCMDDVEELVALKALDSDGESFPDWAHGATLIRDTYFETYAEELASDIGAINESASWPNNCIDWERAARELQQDYSQIEFKGVTYWLRS